jgi:hypothetical protein
LAFLSVVWITIYYPNQSFNECYFEEYYWSGSGILVYNFYVSTRSLIRSFTKYFRLLLCFNLFLTLFPVQLALAQPIDVTGARVDSFDGICQHESAYETGYNCAAISDGQYMVEYLPSFTIVFNGLHLYVDDGWSIVFTPHISITSDRGFSREVAGPTQTVNSPWNGDNVTLDMNTLRTTVAVVSNNPPGEHFTVTVSLDGYYKHGSDTWPLGSGLGAGVGYDGPWVISFFNGVPPITPAPTISSFTANVCYASGGCTTAYNVNPEPLTISYTVTVTNPSDQTLTSAVISLGSFQDSTGNELYHASRTVTNLAPGASTTVNFGSYSHDGSTDQDQIIHGQLSGTYTYANDAHGSLPSAFVDFQIGLEESTCNPTGTNSCDLANCGPGHKCIESTTIPGLYACSDAYAVECDTTLLNCSGTGSYGGFCLTGIQTCANQDDIIPARDCDRCCVQSLAPTDRCVEDRHGTCSSTCSIGTIVTADCAYCCLGGQEGGSRPPLPYHTYQGKFITSLPGLLGPLAKILYYSGLLAGVLSIIYAGYLFITSAGEPHSLDEGKAYLSAGVFGILFIVLSVVIMRIVLSQIIGGNPGF